MSLTRLNRKVEYALMALKYISLHEPNTLIKVKDVCSHTGCPFDATSRVMQNMVQSGLLKSIQGAQGGYLLTKSLADVTFFELNSMILGPLEVVRCYHDSNECDLKESCNIQLPLIQFQTRLESFYKGISLQELLQTSSPNNPIVKTNGERSLNPPNPLDQCHER